MEKRRPVIVGEVLFDCFEDHTALGGAPFNVAWHLAGFGLDPLFISRVGEDPLGGAVREAMGRWGMDPGGLQRDPQRPTGRVNVALKDGQPHYEILADQAYDYVDWRSAQSAAAGAGPALLYHGSLALRRPPAADGLLSLRDATGAPAFVDVNLRAPWWSRELIDGLLSGAAWVKLNDAELGALGGDDGAELAARYGVDALVLTRGEAGATAFVGPQRYDVTGQPVPAMADAVGAGDAFSAVTLAGLLQGWPWPRILDRAARFAARVCEHRGAISEDRALYEATLGSWARGG